jgi:hypothetical protein
MRSATAEAHTAEPAIRVNRSGRKEPMPEKKVYEWTSYDVVSTSSHRAIMRDGKVLVLVMSTPFGWIVCNSNGSVDGYYRTEAFAKDAAEDSLGRP